MSKSLGAGKMRVQPIKPSDIPAARERIIPDAVFDVVNKLIISNMSGGRARILQKEIVDGICAEMASADMPYNRIKDVIYEEHWLDIEDIYRKNGWLVEYDKPAYCESYEPYFVFKMPTKAQS